MLTEKEENTVFLSFVKTINFPTLKLQEVQSGQDVEIVRKNAFITKQFTR